MWFVYSLIGAAFVVVIYEVIWPTIAHYLSKKEYQDKKIAEIVAPKPEPKTYVWPECGPPVGDTFDSTPKTRGFCKPGDPNSDLYQKVQVGDHWEFVADPERTEKRNKERDRDNRLVDLKWALKTRLLTPEELQFVRDNKDWFTGDDWPGWTWNDPYYSTQRKALQEEFDRGLANQARLQFLANSPQSILGDIDG